MIWYLAYNKTLYFIHTSNIKFYIVVFLEQEKIIWISENSLNFWILINI